MNREFAKWLEGRPAIILELARKYPLGTTRKIDGKTAYLCGYSENGGLIMSFNDPWKDYAQALANRFYLCEKCIDLPPQNRCPNHL